MTTEKQSLPEGYRDIYVTAAQLADILGISVQRVYTLTEKSTFVRDPEDKSLPFNLIDNLQSYSSKLRASAQGQSTEDSEYDLVAERAKKEHFLAIKEEVAAAKAVGAVIDRNSIKSAWASIIGNTKSELLSLPSRLQLRIPTLSDDDIAEIDEEIGDALNRLAESGERAVTQVEQSDE